MAAQGLWPVWYPPVLSFLDASALANRAFFFVQAKRWLTTARILPRGSCSLLRELPSSSLPTAGLLTQVCQLPLNLWLSSAPDHLGSRQVSRSSEHLPYSSVLFRSLGRGGCSQPSSFSLAGSRALSGAPSNFYTWIVTVAGSSLLATSGSLASQCLWPPCSNRPRLTASRVLKYARSLLHRHSPLAKGAFLFSRFRRLFATVCFFLAESRAFSRALSFFTG